MARVFNAGGGAAASAAFKLDHINIVTPPQKKEYKSGEPFNPDGLTISATYSNGATLSVSGFDWNPKTLTDGVEYVTISYTEGRTTVTVRQDVTVIPVLKSIRVSKDPDKKDYVYLETFDPEGMEVMAVMSDGSEHKAEGFQTAKPTFQTIGEQQIEITYEEDGVTVKTTYTVDVKRVSLPIPSQTGVLTYNKAPQSPSWNNYEPGKMSVEGNTQTDAGTYEATFTLSYGYQWEGGSIDQKNVEWEIKRAVITETPSPKSSITADGEDHEPEWNNYDPEKLTIDGDTSGSEPNTYTVTFTPTKNYEWDDGTQDPREVTWEIVDAKVLVTVPYQDGTLTYTGDSQTPNWADFDRTNTDISGDTEGTNAKTYTATFTLHEGCAWVTGGNDAKQIQWIIGRATIPAVPKQSGTLTYTGGVQEPGWDTYDESKMTISGDTDGTDAKTYTAHFTPTENYQWDGGDTDAKDATWTIEKASVTLPQQNGTLTYNTSQQEPSWTGNEPGKFTVGGETSGTDAGTYTAEFTPTDNYQWADGGGNEMREATWTIGKATGTLTAHPTEVTLGPDKLSKTVTLVKNGDGDLSVVNGASAICDADISDTDLTIKSKDGKSGTGTVTIKMADGQNYTGAEASVTVNAAFVQVFGVVWDMSNNSTALKRLTVADDPLKLVTTDITTEPTAAVGSEGGSSPFDAFMPWKGMEEYNIMENSAIVKTGEPTFSRTEHDTVVYIPEFGYKAVEQENKIYYYISSIPSEACPKHPGSGKYVGKYVTGANTVTRSGQAPLVSQTRDQFRQSARNKGTGWQQWGYDTWCAIVALYIVEWADWDSQKKVGRGHVDSNSSALQNGQTDTMSYHTGRVDGVDGKTQIMYRWIEGLWGNVRQWVDGYNASGTTTYFCLEPAKYKDGTNTDYTALSVNLPSIGWTKALGVSAAANWAYCPKTVGGSDSAYIPDYVYSSSGWRVLYVGGGWGSGSGAGLCFFYANVSVTYSGSNVGSRLLYDPL